MTRKISRSGAAAGLAAAMLALAACGGAAEVEVEADKEAGADTAEGEAAEAVEVPAKRGAAAASEAETGLPEFEETVKPARCKVHDPGDDYEGPCQFTTWGGGSFVVSRKGGAEFFDGITEVHVEIDAPGIAGGSVRQAGELNFIGTMERHKDDPACWSSEDFTVCAN